MVFCKRLPGRVTGKSIGMRVARAEVWNKIGTLDDTTLKKGQAEDFWGVKREKKTSPKCWLMMVNDG